MTTDNFHDAMLAALQPRLDEADAAWVLEVFAPIRAAASAPRTVLQNWVSELPMMQQSVLLTAVRGPDGLPKYHPVKYLLRWYRRCVLLSSFMHQVITNPVVSDGGSFLGPSVDEADLRCGDCGASNRDDTHNALQRVEQIDHDFTADPDSWASWGPPMFDRVTAYLRDLDAVPHHFQLHLMHAAEIVGYKHPDPKIASFWLHMVYERLVHDMHLWPETVEQMDARLGDNRDGWLARGDVATND